MQQEGFREPGPTEIDVWAVSLETQDADLQRLDELLSPEERERSQRFRFEHLRRSYVTAHGVLRTLLGQYTGEPPASIRFLYGPKGKPALAGETSLQFNLSHSGEMAAFAFAREAEIGVDLEHIRSMDDCEAIARRFFCAEEFAELMSLPAEQRDLAFFLCWTRKEAFIKALGEGLSQPLDSFRVSLKPGEPARFVHIAGSADHDWKLHDLDLATGYAAALAYRGPVRSVRIARDVRPTDLYARGTTSTSTRNSCLAPPMRTP